MARTGRPRKYTTPTVQVALRVPEDRLAAVDAYATTNNLSRNDAIVRAVDSMLGHLDAVAPKAKAKAKPDRPTALCKQHKALAVRPDGRCGQAGCKG